MNGGKPRESWTEGDYRLNVSTRLGRNDAARTEHTVKWFCGGKSTFKGVSVKTRSEEGGRGG